MLTLSYGYKKPQTGDQGATLFDALALNAQLLNDHNHDGTTAARLTPTTQTISSGSWGASIGNGLYKQTVTLPAGLNYDTLGIAFKLSSGTVIYPKVVRISTTQYDVYTNDNTQSLTAVYTH